MVNKKVTGTAVSMPVGIGLGVLVSTGIMLCLAALEAWLALSGRVEESIIGYLSMGNLLLSSLVGALVAAGKIKRRRMMVCLITGGVFYLLLLGCTALFFGGYYQGAAVGGCVILAAAGVAGVLGLRKSEGRIKGYKKYTSC